MKDNKLGIMPISKLIWNMSLPIIASMLVQALYNIVDSVFVSQVSEQALTAVTLAFPAQNLMIAVATGTGVGVNALLSRCLGEKNFDHVNKTANHALFLAICNFIVFAVLGLFFSRTFFPSPDGYSGHRRTRDVLSHDLYGILLRPVWRNHM